jgi:hypothetical protein
MKLANRAFIVALTMLILIFSISAQTLRPETDPRNQAPTVGTGGPPGGPTGLFTVYDGSTLRKGEFTFSIAYSNFDRDPGDVDITEVPVSFQIGLNDYLELFFNTDAYRAVKVNSPRNLSGFYLPNSNAGFSFPAIVLGSGNYANTAVYRPGGTQPFVQYPFIGGAGFPQFPVLGSPTTGGEGASNYPLIGSPYGSILPGVVLQTAVIANGTIPTSFSIAPAYLNDAPFINRTYGESSFNTFTVGAKWRWTGPNNPVGVGVIPFYRFYADKADDFSGFNQLQRGASPGSGRGDIGAIFFADARVRKWMNISGNVGYIWNGDVEDGNATLLDRGDELISAVAVDFPVNKYFQPILEFRSQQFVGGRTPNAFENNPLDGLAGFRVFPARWLGFGFAYRYHFNQQDRGSFDDEDSFTSSVTVLCPELPTPGGTGCVPFTVTNNWRGIPPGFQTSNDPHGFIFQGWIGRRNKRQAEIINIPANVDSITTSATEVWLPCPPGTRSESGRCSDEMSVNVTTSASDAEGDTLVYNYTVSGGRIVGTGANVTWDLSGVRPGSYTITAGVDDGCGVCGTTQTTTVEVKECDDCVAICECPTISVTGPADVVQPGETMTFTANVSGGSQDDVTYEWSVSQGTIVEGQGTPMITVDTTGLSDTTIEATVNVGGLCGDCNPNASETGVVAPLPEAIPIDEFGRLANDDVRARLDAFFTELSNNPNDTGYIINYGPARQVTARERLIRNHIALRRFDASRIVIVNGGEEPEIRTRLWRVPPGAQPPTP